MKIINAKIALTFVRVDGLSDETDADNNPTLHNRNPQQVCPQTLPQHNTKPAKLSEDFAQDIAHTKPFNSEDSSDDVTGSMTSSIRVLMPCAQHMQAQCLTCAKQRESSNTENNEQSLNDSMSDTESNSPGNVFHNRAFSPGTTLTSSTRSMAGDDAHSDCLFSLFQQLLECRFVSLVPPPREVRVNFETGLCESCESELCDNVESFCKTFPTFFQLQVRRLLTDTVSLLNIIHRRGQQSFINTAFDLARDVQVTPVRLEFVRDQEKRLFEQLVTMVNKKQDDVCAIIKRVVQHMRTDVVAAAMEYDFIGSKSRYVVVTPIRDRILFY